MADADGLSQAPGPFMLERFFEKHEFTARHLLCCSDCEPLTMKELLAMADPDARQRWDNLRLSYTEPAGLLALREAISADLYGGALAPDQLLVCAPEEGVYLAMKALLRPGDRVVCAYPAYQSLYELALATGCALDFWEPSWDAAAGALTFDVARLEALVAGEESGGGGGREGGGERGKGAQTGGGGRGPCRLVVVNFPHNPTGAMLSRGGQARVVEAARRAGAYLFSDEMYWRLEPDESLHLPPAAPLYDRALSLCGVSKSWALPGLRVGWVGTRDAALLARMATLKDYTTICTAGPSEVLALIAVRATKALTARSRALVAENTRLAGAFFARWAALFDWRPPAAGPVAFPRLRLDALRELDSGGGGGGGGGPIASVDAFCELVVSQAGVLLLPASVYQHAPSEAAGHFRVGLGRAGTGAALAALEAFLASRFPRAAVVAEAAAAAPRA